MRPNHLFQNIYSDYRRYRATGEKGFLQIILFSQGFWASSVNRVSHQIFRSVQIPVIRQLFRFFSMVTQKFIEILTGIQLPAKCRVGRGLYIGHFGQIIIHPEAKIGNNCNLSQGVTIGVLEQGKNKGVPQTRGSCFCRPKCRYIGWYYHWR